MSLKLPAPQPYDFARTVRDHGWIALAPFRWLDEGNGVVQRIERLNSGKVVMLRIYLSGKQIVIDSEPDNVTPAEKNEIRDKVRWMLRLDEDFTEFYAISAQQDAALSATVSSGRGRLLRSPSLFQDVICTICTTNTTWSQTKGMVARLVERLGDAHPAYPDLRAFPTPEQIADASADVFQSEIRLGYRGAYVQQLAREVAEGQRDLDSLATSNLSTADLKRELKKIKGVGDYAAHTLLMLLGHYDEVAVDTELRAHVRRVHPNGHTLTDKEMAALFEPWEKWKYLAYWYSMIESPVT